MKLLLDYDNTMALTEPVAMANACKQANQVLSLHGVTFQYQSDKFTDLYTGSTYRSMLEDLQKTHKVALTSAEVEAEVIREMETAIVALGQPGALKPTPGIMKALEVLCERFPAEERAVVSSTAIERLNVCLVSAEQAKFFHKELIFSAQSSLPTGPKPKPEPDIYEFAMDKMGGPKIQFIAFEDSKSGVLSAKRAGITHIVGFVGSEPFEKQRALAHKLFDYGAKIVINDMFKVVEINDKLMAGEGDYLLAKYGPKAWGKQVANLAYSA